MTRLSQREVKPNILKSLKSFVRSNSLISEGKYRLDNIDYASILDQLDQIVCVKNQDGVYVMVNQAFCDLTGLNRIDILDKDDLQLGFHMNPQIVKTNDLKAFTTRSPLDIPIEKITDYFGITLLFRTKRLPIFDEDNNVEFILFIVRDVTASKSEEQRLQKSKLRYKSIFDNNYSGIIVVSQYLEILKKQSI